MLLRIVNVQSKAQKLKIVGGLQHYWFLVKVQTLQRMNACMLAEGLVNEVETVVNIPHDEQVSTLAKQVFSSMQHVECSRPEELFECCYNVTENACARHANACSLYLFVWPL